MSFKFLGASLMDISASIGWGDTPSRLSINLAEDTADGDSFASPDVGTPYVFGLQQWLFGGIIQSWRAKDDTSGNPIYEVVMVDPREILSGVILILDNYNGTVSIPNLLNVYGYLESTGFGASRRNEAGIPWGLVRTATVALTQGINPSYGDSIAIGSFNFEINLDELPELPQYYRVGSTSMSLLEFVGEICDAANHDYFFAMNFDVNGNRYITLKTINRNIEPTFGAITNFIATTPGAVSKDAGFEFRQETMGKFLVGGPLSDMFIQNSSVDTDDFWNSTIWPFWGFTNDGRVLLGEGINDSHSVTLDASWIPEWPGNTYSTDVGEMRAAKEGIDSWKRFLSARNFNRFRKFADGDVEEEDDKGRTYYTNGELNPHYRKAEVFKFQDIFDVDDIVQGLTSLQDLTADKINSFKKNAVQQAQLVNANLIREQAMNQVFGYISSFAREYYGRKFMIRTPNIDATTDSETGEIRYSAEPESSGFLDESTWPTAVENNFMPVDVNKFTEENGRVFAYVRFDNAANLDFGEIPENDVAIGDNGTSVFVKCQVEPTLIFRDGTTLNSPRAVVTLPGAVKEKITTTNANNQFESGWTSIITNALYTSLVGRANNDNFNDPDTGQPYSEQDIRNRIQKLHSLPGGDNTLHGAEARAVQPNVAAVPFRSNIATYGPWFKGGANGKMEFEADESLVPWNFGGFSVMNLAAEARVNSANSNYQQSESGSIQVPGVPEIGLGEQLINGGPYVTDVNVSISEAGIISNYRMNTWTPQPYKTSKQAAASVSRLAKTGQQVRRNLREQRKNVGRTLQAARSKQLVRELGRRRTSTNNYMLAEAIQRDGRVGKGTLMTNSTDYNMLTQMGGGDFTFKAGQSMDAMFRPFSTDTSQSGLPIFSPVNQKINPFKDSDFNFVLSGDSLKDSYDPSSSGNFDEDNARGIGLRFPLIGVGYGHDTNGNPVPNASGDGGTSSDFADNYKKRQDLWKAGPVTGINWNNTENEWQVQSGESNDPSGVILVKIIEESGFPSTVQKNVYRAEVFDFSFSESEGSEVSFTSKNQFKYVGNMRPNLVLENTFYLAHKLGTKYLIDNQATFVDFQN